MEYRQTHSSRDDRWSGGEKSQGGGENELKLHGDDGAMVVISFDPSIKLWQNMRGSNASAIAFLTLPRQNNGSCLCFPSEVRTRVVCWMRRVFRGDLGLLSKGDEDKRRSRSRQKLNFQATKQE